MKTVCAWCNAEINSHDPVPGGIGTISYGICLPCANRFIVETPFDLRTFLDDVAVPVALVDCDGIVRLANGRAQAMTGKEPDQIEGFSGGDVFQCIYARRPEGCGNSVHCSGCTIRRTVMETHATGYSRYRVPATLKQETADRQQEIRLLISTDKFGDCVLLRIEPAE